MNNLSVNTAVLPPVKLIVVWVSWKASARHDVKDAGVKSTTRAAPITPVSPVTVMVKFPPSVGVVGLMATEVTLLGLALPMESTDVNEKFWLVSKGPEVGG